jgi:hypothetical protein
MDRDKNSVRPPTPKYEAEFVTPDQHPVFHTLAHAQTQAMTATEEESDIRPASSFDSSIKYTRKSQMRHQPRPDECPFCGSCTRASSFTYARRYPTFVIKSVQECLTVSP